MIAARPSATVARVGLVSDTHGWLDPRVVRALEAEQPLEVIVHAGDIGSPEVLHWLLTLAPRVEAVLGNCDTPMPGYDLAGVARLTVRGVRILAIHDIADLPAIPDDVDVVVRGHSHIPGVEQREHALVVNPGSASQRRRQPSCTIGVLDIAENGAVSARILDLDDFGPRLR